MTYRQAITFICRHLLIPALFAVVVCSSLAAAATHPAVDLNPAPPDFTSSTQGQ